MNRERALRGLKHLSRYARANIHNWMGKVGPLERLKIGVTSSCNSKCLTCDIWRRSKDGEPDIEREHLQGLLESKVCQSIRSIELTGGEPFLRKDIYGVIELLARFPRSKISIATNGLLTDRIVAVAKASRSVAAKIEKFSLSINGPPSIHDQTRGIKGGFDRVVDTAKSLRKLGYDTVINFTITKTNVSYINWTYKFAKQINAQISFFPEIRSNRYKNADGEMEYSKAEREEIIRQLKSVYGDRHYYYYDDSSLWFVDNTLRKEQVCRCTCGMQNAFINWDGLVYPCEGLVDTPHYFGSIREMNFDDLWESERATKVRDYIRQDMCQPCFLSCDILDSLRKRVIPVLGYMARNRLGITNIVKS